MLFRRAIFVRRVTLSDDEDCRAFAVCCYAGTLTMMPRRCCRTEQFHADATGAAADAIFADAIFRAPPIRRHCRFDDDTCLRFFARRILRAPSSQQLARYAMAPLFIFVFFRYGAFLRLRYADTRH